MEMYSSEENDSGVPWVQYLLAVFVALVPLSLSVSLRNSAMIGTSVSFMLLLTAGVIFSGLGLYSSAKDTHKGFGMLSLVAGAALIGISQLPSL